MKKLSGAMRWKNILRCSKLWSKKNLFIIASSLILLAAGLIGEFIAFQRIIAQLLFLAVLGIAGQSIIRRGFFFLVKKSLNGDIKSFGELVEKYRQTVYALCYHRIGNFQDAQDLVQEIFLKDFAEHYPGLRFLALTISFALLLSFFSFLSVKF